MSHPSPHDTRSSLSNNKHNHNQVLPTIRRKQLQFPSTNQLPTTIRHNPILHSCPISQCTKDAHQHTSAIVRPVHSSHNARLNQRTSQELRKLRQNETNISHHTMYKGQIDQHHLRITNYEPAINTTSPHVTRRITKVNILNRQQHVTIKQSSSNAQVPQLYTSLHKRHTHTGTQYQPRAVNNRRSQGAKSIGTVKRYSQGAEGARSH